MSTALLPTYDRPPVVETILSVQFDALAGFRNAHLGAFWKCLPTAWVHVSDAPPLDPQFEHFTDEAKWTAAGLQLRLSQEVRTRLQIQNEQRSRMIQVQNGRFLFNWIGVHGDPYPRYERVREQFIENFESFREFLSREQLGSLAPNQWEVTYLNHIPRDSVWANVRGWTFFRPVNVVEGIPRLTSLESLAGEWHYVIEPKRGRLHVQWQHGRRNGQELIVLNLTSRGPIGKCPGESPLPRILEGLDLGREVIVRSFGSLMDDRANKYWGLHDETH